MRLRLLTGLLLVVCVAAPVFAQVTDAEQGRATNISRAPLTPSPRRDPLAYGFVYENGTIASGTANFTVNWNSSANWYEIQLTGINYYYSNYSTVVTVTIPHLTFCHTDSVGGKLLVRCFNESGNPIQADFAFGVF